MASPTTRQTDVLLRDGCDARGGASTSPAPLLCQQSSCRGLRGAMARGAAAIMTNRALLSLCAGGSPATGEGVLRSAPAALGSVSHFCMGTQGQTQTNHSPASVPSPAPLLPNIRSQAVGKAVQQPGRAYTQQVHGHRSLLLGFMLGGGAGVLGLAAYSTTALAGPSRTTHQAQQSAAASTGRGVSTEASTLASSPYVRRAGGEGIADSFWAKVAAAGAVASTAIGSISGSVSQLQEAAPASPTAPKESVILGPHFIADAAEKAAPAVVNVTVTHGRGNHGLGVFATKSSGSGFIVDSEGVILTNAHVVLDASSGRHPQPARGITITLQDGRIFEGDVVSFDRISDIAVIRVKCDEPLPTVKLGTSSGLRVGEWIVSLGSPLHLQNSVTCGIISCVDRKAVDLGLAGACPEYIQTDAPINQGSSGGPLINLAGEVIGITSMKAVAADGVSFAIPIDMAKNIMKQLSEQGRVIRPYIGIKMLELNPMIAKQLRQRDKTFPEVEAGILVVGVAPGSPAESAGLQAGDVIVEFQAPSRAPISKAGKATMSSDLIDSLGANVGSAITVKVLRTSRFGTVSTYTVTVTASEAISRD